MSLQTMRPFVVRFRNADSLLTEAKRRLADAQREYDAAHQELVDALAQETI